MWLLAKNLLFTVLVPGTVAVLVPLLAFAHGGVAMSVHSAIALLPLLAGASIYAWCVWDFALTGGGTPAPIDPPKVLVVRGLYRYTRNPMYVGVLCVIGGWAWLFASWPIAVYGIAVAAAFHTFVIGYEEPHLARTFGAAYVQYKDEVGRWLPRRQRTRL